MSVACGKIGRYIRTPLRRGYAGGMTDRDLSTYLRPFALRVLPTARLEALCARLMDIVAEAVMGDFLGLARAVRKLQAAEVALARLRGWNARVAAKRAMLGDAGRRAEVRARLGGVAGLARWEARAERRLEQGVGEGVGEVSRHSSFETHGCRQAPQDKGPAWRKDEAFAGAKDGWPADTVVGRFGLPPLPRVPRKARRKGLAALAPVEVAAQRVMARAIPIWPCELRWRAERRARASAKDTASGDAARESWHVDGVRYRALPTRGEFGASVERVLRVVRGLASEPV